MSEQHGDVEVELSRDLGLVSALAIGVGTMIAAGIFTLSGLAVGYVGSAAIVSFLLAAFVATFTALTYCEFSSIYPQSGEGYLYSRKTFPAPVAYLVGWCLLLGYTSSCGFYIASLSSYFAEFIWHPPVVEASGLVALVLLTLLNIRGTKESGAFQIIVTAVKVLLLMWFVAGGMSHVDPADIAAKFSTDIAQISNTAALVFITFFGFSAIAASAGEVKDPEKTIPRAIFISMVMVTILYTAVVLVVVAADLTEYTELAMGKAANDFLGSWGGAVIIGGALFSMISASNASILAGSRVALSMSQLGHLPKEIGSINERTRTPVIALLLVGAAIGLFAVLMPLEELANFANCVLLIVLTVVNAALIAHRRQYPDMERPFRVPLVPLVPALGMLANGYLLSQIQHWETIAMATGAIMTGMLGFLAWKGSQGDTAALKSPPSIVALERAAPVGGGFSVLVPIANPDNVDRLIDLAADVASSKQGHIVALRVVLVPDQLPPALELDSQIDEQHALLDGARARAKERGVPITTLVRIGRSISGAVLETAAERECDLVLLGWKGHTSTAQRVMGETIDEVVRYAQRDIMLVTLKEDGAPEASRILVPIAASEHGRATLEYVANIARARRARLTLCSVTSDASQEDAERSRLHTVAGEAQVADLVDTIEVVHNDSVVDGIISAAKGHDLMALGATRDSFTQQILFGNTPEQIASRAEIPVMVVKRHDAVRALVGRVMSE